MFELSELAEKLDRQAATPLQGEPPNLDKARAKAVSVIPRYILGSMRDDVYRSSVAPHVHPSDTRYLAVRVVRVPVACPSRHNRAPHKWL